MSENGLLFRCSSVHPESCFCIRAYKTRRTEPHVGRLTVRFFTPTPAASLTLPGTISSIRVFLLWYGAMGNTYHSGQLTLFAPLLPACLATSRLVDDALPAIITCRLPLRLDLTSAVLSKSLSDRQAQSVATTPLEAHAAVAVVPEGFGLVVR